MIRVSGKTIRKIALAGAFASVFVLITAAGLNAQTHQQKEFCVNRDRDYSPDVQIKACTEIAQISRGRQLAVSLNNRGNAFKNKGEVDRAIEDFTRSIKADPTYDLPYYNRGSAFADKKDFDRAIADYNEAIRLDPDDSRNFNMRGNAFRDKNDLASALFDYDRALQLNPKNSIALNNRGHTYVRMQEFDRAITDFNESIRLNPRNSLPYMNRADAWRRKGDTELALTDVNKAIELQVQSKLKPSLAYLIRGDIYRYRGEFEKAITEYERVIADDSNFAYAFTGRGMTYERMGEVERAKDDFRKALNAPPLYLDSTFEAQETARARLAALDAGVPLPEILPVQKRTEQKSLPTPKVTVPAMVEPSRVQGKRVALVIGNSAYEKVAKLPNPQRDADKIAQTLKNIGFEVVTIANDMGREKLSAALREFANESEKADWAVVYYAGHGIEVNGLNYLIPVDAKLAVDRDVQYEAIPLDQVMTAVEGAKKLRLVLLDACRDNPFTPVMRKSPVPQEQARASTSGGTIATRTLGRGLGEVKISGATLVVYAAKHGQLALDGEGENSPFAVALVQRLATPGVEINKIFRLVRDDVMEATAGRQEPYTYGSLPGREDFFFVTK